MLERFARLASMLNARYDPRQMDQYFDRQADFSVTVPVSGVSSTLYAQVPVVYSLAASRMR
jgi:hypothetical protein